MQATIEAPRASVLRYRIVSVVLAVALAVAVAWALMAEGRTESAVRDSKPVAASSSARPVSADADAARQVGDIQSKPGRQEALDRRHYCSTVYDHC
jgi:hypothetical protein